MGVAPLPATGNDSLHLCPKEFPTQKDISGRQRGRFKRQTRVKYVWSRLESMCGDGIRRSGAIAALPPRMREAAYLLIAAHPLAPRPFGATMQRTDVAETRKASSGGEPVPPLPRRTEIIMVALQADEALWYFDASRSVRYTPSRKEEGETEEPDLPYDSSAFVCLLVLRTTSTATAPVRALAKA